MARDGTSRGGARPGAGRKSKPLFEKMQDGQASDAPVLPEPAELEAADVPPVRDFLKAAQKSGKDLCAEEVFSATWRWLAERRCGKLVNRNLIEQYAMSVSRWIQCEECISEYGFLAKHPTTGAAIQSPYVAMSQSFMKQSNQIWYQIYQIVKDNSTSDLGGRNPQDDIMERLLSARRGQ